MIRIIKIAFKKTKSAIKIVVEVCTNLFYNRSQGTRALTIAGATLIYFRPLSYFPILAGLETLMIWGVGIMASCNAMVEFRESYKIRGLIQERKIAAELDQKSIAEIDQNIPGIIARTQKIDQLYSEVAKVFLPIIKKKNQTFIEQLKVTESPLYKIKKKNKTATFYILGTHHSIPFVALPPKIQQIIKELLLDPKAFVIGEAFSCISGHLYLETIITSSKNMIGKFLKNLMKNIIKVISKLIVTFFSPFSAMSRLIETLNRGIKKLWKEEPWYLNKALAPLTFHAMIRLREEIIKEDIWEVFDFDSSAEEAFNVFLKFKSRKFEIDWEGFHGLFPTSKGMDTSIIMLALEAQRFTSQGLDEAFMKITLQTKLPKMEDPKIIDQSIGRFLAQCKMELEQVSNENKLKNEIAKALCSINDEFLSVHKSYPSKIKKPREIRVECFIDWWKVLFPSVDLNANWLHAAVDKRNFSWKEPIINLMETHESGLIFVGETHLHEENGLLKLLEQDGFQIEHVHSVDNGFQVGSDSGIEHRNQTGQLMKRNHENNNQLTLNQPLRFSANNQNNKISEEKQDKKEEALRTRKSRSSSRGVNRT